ncbi:MAG: hypothetical protein HN855_06400 [Anaerolineae bacterium]|jgi:hypothetical protein|nr:hypothetical protein [Anaerolineae bacterium]MBT7071815.1 hypothetical protein [Anaerolineae bacterium]MBT7324768.1 hypothetical protein [Anaerolineae bacterium]
MNINQLLKALFYYEEEKKYPWLTLVILLFLLAIGIFFWGNFLDWRHTTFNFHDWGDINIPRIDAVQDGLRQFTFPLHLANTSSLHGVTDRIWVLPDIISTPQMLLLYWFETETYILFDVFFHFLLGALGLLLIRKEFKLSLFTYSVLLTLFSANGYIQAHYGVGHFSWGGYFLFPIFFALMLRFSSGEVGWKWVTQVAFVLFYMVLAGSEHHFFWLLIWLGGFALGNLRRIKWIFYAGLFGGLLSAVRLLPPALGLGNFFEKFMSFGGFPTLLDILNAMTVLTPIRAETMNLLRIAAVWEYDLYIGFVGTAFILYFGLYQWIRSKKYQDFIFPTFLVLFLTLGDIYRPFFDSQLPFLSGERMITRMAILPIVVLMVMAAIQFQRWLDTRHLSLIEALVFFIPFLFLVNDLRQHYLAWNVRELAKFFDPVIMNVIGNSLSDHQDTLYTNTLVTGLFISIATALFLLSRLWTERKKAAE